MSSLSQRRESPRRRIEPRFNPVRLAICIPIAALQLGQFAGSGDFTVMLGCLSWLWMGLQPPVIFDRNPTKKGA